MARNRKRGKDRRARHPEAASVRAGRADSDGAPDPIEHAAPDVELAEAQLAAGRPAADERVDDLEFSMPAAEPVGDGPGGPGQRPPDSDASEPSGEGDSAGQRLPVRREPVGRRLIGFLQGSWRELQRVQWPDRRQVMQATSVVIGFVIVAGAFLGVADFLAGKLISLILK